MMKQRSVKIGEELWSRAKQAARIASVDEGQDVTVSDLIRRGLRAECAKIKNRGDLEPGG